MSRHEVAEHLGVSVDTVDRLVREGCPSVKLDDAPTGARRFRKRGGAWSLRFGPGGAGAHVVEWHAGERGEADGTGSVSSVQSPAAKLHVPETATG